MQTTHEPVRLSKLMAERGLCSRREADSYIEKGLVLVDGQPVTVLGTKVLPNQKIELAPQAQKKQDELMTIIINKPIGYVSGQPEDPYKPAVVLVTPENQDDQFEGPELERKHLMGLAPAGRLDIDSVGLLVMTQDGRLARKLVGGAGENASIEKEYLVRVRGKLSERGLKLLQHGLKLDDKALRPAKIEWINEDQLRFVLIEGKKRQIRRMCEQVGIEVVGLKRVRIGKIRLGKLAEGKWRFLRPGEVF
ncbi:MAG: pseudouridine synthase [Bdellovibrionia bacterium]